VHARGESVDTITELRVREPEVAAYDGLIRWRFTPSSGKNVRQTHGDPRV
jgi:hypothetical protein